MHKSHIFRVYDIRGVTDECFDDVFVGELAISYALYLKGKGETSCCIGRDGRLTSPRYHQLLIDGLAQSGIDVFDLGEVTTPIAYFSCFQSQWSPNAIMVTASHNPKSYNGFKFVVQTQPLYGEMIQTLRQQIDEGLPKTETNRSGKISPVDVVPTYIAYLKENVSYKNPHKFIVDCGNGMAGKVVREVFDTFGFDTKILYEEVDGRFPNHPSDPTKEENLKEVISTLKGGTHDYEFGVGYDGDADRIGVVTPKGQLLYGDTILLLLTEEMVRKYKNPTIIADVKSSKIFFERAKQMGASPEMYKTGHSLIKARLNRTPNCPLAGEMSGHIFYKDNFFGFDDGIYVTLRLIQLLESLDIDLQRWCDALPQTSFTPEIHVPCADDQKHRVVSELTTVCSEKYPEANLITVDGIRLEWPDRWALIRVSNTTPVLVLRFEGETQSACEDIKQEITELVKAHIES